MTSKGEVAGRHRKLTIYIYLRFALVPSGSDANFRYTLLRSRADIGLTT